MKKSSEELADLQDQMAIRREKVQSGQVRVVPPSTQEQIKEAVPPVQKSDRQ